MKTIIAIGGGEMGGPIFDEKHNVIGHYGIETTGIDEIIVRATKKKTPKALFIPTASWDNAGYCQSFKKQYEDNLGCQVSNLLLLSNPSMQDIEKSILEADIIYVGGGNTQFMQDTWKKHGLLPLLKQAYEKGTILSGLSAGANCWFEKSSTDSFMTAEDKLDFEKAKETLAIMDNLGYLEGVLCPHYLKESYRRPSFLHQMKKIEGKAYGVDNNAALVFIDGKLTNLLKSAPQAKAFEIFSQNGVVSEKEIDLPNLTF